MRKPDCGLDSWDYKNLEGLLTELKKAAYLQWDEFGEQRTDLERERMTPQIRGHGNFFGRNFYVRD